MHRVSAAFRADPALELSRDDIQRLTELEPAETDVVIEALADARIVAPIGARVRAGEAPASPREPAAADRPNGETWRPPPKPTKNGRGAG